MDYCKRYLTDSDRELLERIEEHYKNDFNILGLIRRYAFEIELDHTLLVNYGIDVSEFPEIGPESLTAIERLELENIMHTYADSDLTSLVVLYTRKRTRDYFLENEKNIKIRRCDHCGRPMFDGYVLGDTEHACSYSCAVHLYGEPIDDGIKQFEEDLKDADEPYGETYWTEWEDFFVEL